MSIIFLFAVQLYILLTRVSPSHAFSFFCSKDQYSTPNQQDCYRALAAFPVADGSHRYFVEQQMRIAFPSLDWPRWSDPRPPYLQQKVVQIPKFWNLGNCNFALLSYVHGDFASPVSFTTWSDIFNSALQLAHNCLVVNQRGGAAIVPGKLPLLLEDELYFANDMEAANGAPTLTVFMWENGAYFEHILAQYTSATFPSGIDPSTLRLAQFSSTGNDSGGYLNGEVGTNVTKPVDTA